MQPPPRKGQYLKVCKNLHSEQLSKLQAKNQQECDLLEDIRNFTKQRSAIEKSYGEALCKISSTYQNRKIACVPDIRLEDGSDAWNIYSVWRTVLDETEKLGKARLAAVEVFHQRISEDAKQTRQVKINLQKKFTENLSVIQKDLQNQVQDLDRTKKGYYDEENVAYDAREKASAAEEKLKRKKGSLFQSISSLQKNSAKFTAKKELCDEKSAGARNDYLICLAATNAHQKRYYEIDFERILRTMENDMYEKIADYFTLLSRTELLTCTATQNSYSNIKEQAQTITRGYNLRCYLTFYPMLGKNIEYEYEPCKGDKIDHVTVHDENAKEQLNLESQRSVARIIKEVKTIREANKKIRKLQSSKKGDGDLPPEVESKIEEIRQIIRRCETAKCKAEAKLETLREGGIEVEDYSRSIEAESFEENMETGVSRSGSSLDVKEETDLKEAEIDGEVQTTSVSEKQFSTESTEPERETEQEGAILEQAVSKSMEQPNWDPLSVDWGDEAASPLPPVTNGPPQDEPVYPKCIVQYNYTAQNVDELTIVENEELEVVSEGDGDGWIQARNYKGEIGYIPQNYVEMEEGTSLPPIQGNPVSEYSEDTTTLTEGYGTSNGYDTQYCNIQTGDEVTETEGGTLSYEPPSEQPPPLPPGILAEESEKPKLPDLDLPEVVDNQQTAAGSFCVALYDYEATCSEEITFNEGQIIRILKKTVHDVDDGWWEGEVDGQVGLFPSLVVEECRVDGEPLTPDAASITSPCTTPPPHTPPEVPGFLLPPERVIITQPTPDVETAQEAMAMHENQATHDKEIVGDQQQQYQRQFSSSPDSETATEKDHQYAELVSSPDVSNQEVTDPETLKDVENSLTDSPDTIEDLKEDKQDLSADGFPPPPPALVIAPEEEDATPVAELEPQKKPDSAQDAEENEMSSSGTTNKNLTLHGLDVAQIIVTAATPMKEKADQEEAVIPTAEDSRVEADQAGEDDGQAESEDTEGEANFLDDDRPPPPPPAPEGGGGSGVEERNEEYESEVSSSSFPPPSPAVSANIPLSTLPISSDRKSVESDSLERSTPTPKSPSPSDGPPDLDPEKLKTLEKIKESIA